MSKLLTVYYSQIVKWKWKNKKEYP